MSDISHNIRTLLNWNVCPFLATAAVYAHFRRKGTTKFGSVAWSVITWAAGVKHVLIPSIWRQVLAASVSLSAIYCPISTSTGSHHKPLVAAIVNVSRMPFNLPCGAWVEWCGATCSWCFSWLDLSGAQWLQCSGICEPPGSETQQGQSLDVIQRVPHVICICQFFEQPNPE